MKPTIIPLPWGFGTLRFPRWSSSSWSRFCHGSNDSLGSTVSRSSSRGFGKFVAKGDDMIIYTKHWGLTKIMVSFSWMGLVFFLPNTYIWIIWVCLQNLNFGAFQCRALLLAFIDSSFSGDLLVSFRLHQCFKEEARRSTSIEFLQYPGWWFDFFCFFHPYLVRRSNLTIIFFKRVGSTWFNHQLVSHGLICGGMGDHGQPTNRPRDFAVDDITGREECHGLAACCNRWHGICLKTRHMPPIFSWNGEG